MDTPCDAMDIRKCSFTVLLSVGPCDVLSTVTSEKKGGKKTSLQKNIFVLSDTFQCSTVYYNSFLYNDMCTEGYFTLSLIRLHQ